MSGNQYKALGINYRTFLSGNQYIFGIDYRTKCPSSNQFVLISGVRYSRYHFTVATLIPAGMRDMDICDPHTGRNGHFDNQNLAVMSDIRPLHTPTDSHTGPVVGMRCTTVGVTFVFVFFRLPPHFFSPAIFSMSRGCIL